MLLTEAYKQKNRHYRMPLIWHWQCLFFCAFCPFFTKSMLYGIKKELETENTLESELRLDNLMEFKSITATFEERTGSVNLGDFLEELSLVADIEEHKNNDDVVTLMTLHSAKGLEFKVVFITGMEEGIFPCCIWICVSRYFQTSCSRCNNCLVFFF